MKNDRPIANPKLQRALNSVRATMQNHGFAGAVMLVSEDEAAFTYVLHAPWSAIRSDPQTPLGFRIRASEAEDGLEGRHNLLTGAAHTICQLADFGSQTQDWMEQLKAMLRKTGLVIDHAPFNGQPVPPIERFDESEGEA